MNDSAPYRLAVVAAIYAAYLIAYFILGDEVFGIPDYFWHEAVVIVATVAALAWSGLRTTGALRRFLLMAAGSVLFLLVTEVSYGQDFALGREAVGNAVQLSDAAYLVFLFSWICSWGYLALELGRRHPPSLRTVALFAILMAGFVLLFAGFYDPVYRGQLGTLSGRVDATMAALELGSVIAGLAVVLLGVSTGLVLQVYGMTLLAASDMLYSKAAVDPDGFAAIDPVWMLGLCMLLAGALVLPRLPAGDRDADPLATLSGRAHRSGLSALLLALSLGAVLLSAVVTLGLENYFDSSSSSAGEPFFLVLFVVLLVVVMVWITDHFDRAVRYAKDYSVQLLGARLTGSDWRDGGRRLAWILEATGLGAQLDSFRSSAARLREEVLFLGPERLNPPPREPEADGEPECFIMMPFGLEDSDEVHRVLRRVCLEAGVRPVRGDDLFTPTDILDDIWRGITGARFIIADITGRNPNVLYELGMAHTLAKPVLILSRHADDIPIDLSTRRVILYGTSGDGDWQADLAGKAAAAIQAILREYPETGAGTPGPGANGALDRPPGGQ